MASDLVAQTIRLKPPVRDRLRARAEREGRTPGDLARWLLERALDGKEGKRV